MGKLETVSDFIFLGSKITADGDCSHEIKRRLLLGRKVMTNLDNILKSKDIQFSSVHFSSVTQSCLTLCDPMNCSTPGLSVHHQLLEFTQTHVHRVGDGHPAISSSVVPFSCPQSLPASEFFLFSFFFRLSEILLFYFILF